METGCGLLLLVFVVASVWWVVHTITSKSKKDKLWEARFESLQAELAGLKVAVARLEQPATQVDSRGSTAQANPLPTASDPLTAATTPPAEEPLLAPPMIPPEEPAHDHPTATRGTSPTDPWRVADPLADLSAEPAEESAHRTESKDEPPPGPPAGEAPTPPSSSSKPAKPPQPPIDWEQWVGVRGLAVLAGIVAAVAGIFFVRFSIDKGLIPPIVRVALLMLAGIGSVGFGERLRKRGHVFPASALQGAGIVMLYAATCSARTLYDLIGSGSSFVLMALITVAGGTLAVRHASLVIALLGLLGGFATPLLISSGSDNVVGLFGYLLLLNAGVALVGRRGHWPILSALSLAATVLYQGAWIFGAMQGRIGIGLLILGVFALFFLWNAEHSRNDNEESLPRAFSLSMTLGALFSPFVFAVYFASQADLGDRLLPMGGLLLMLNASAAWIARRRDLPVLAVGTVAATLGVLAVWPITQDLEFRGLLEAMVGLVLLSLLHQATAQFLGTNKDSLRWRLPQFAAALLALALAGLLHTAQWLEREPSGWLMAGVIMLAGLLLWQSRRWFLSPNPAASEGSFTENSDSASDNHSDESKAYLAAQARQTLARLSWIPAGGAALGIGALFLVSILLRSFTQNGAGFLQPPWLVVCLLLFGVVLQVLAVERTRLVEAAPQALHGAQRRNLVLATRSVEWALALFPLLALGALFLSIEEASKNTDLAPALWLTSAAAIVLGLFSLLTATRLGNGRLMAMALFGTAAVQTMHADHWVEAGWLGLTLVATTIALFTLWPMVFSSTTALAVRQDPSSPHQTSTGWPLAAWRTAALAPILLAPAFHTFFTETFGQKSSAGSMLVLAAGSVLGLRSATAKASSTQQASIQAWFGGVALVFIAIAVPLQLDREWITVGWALLAVGIAALWLRVDHAGLKLFAIGLGCAVLARLILNPEVFRYHEPRAPFGLPVLGWLLYTYLLPALALLAAARLFERREAERLRSWEPFRQRGLPWAAGILAAFGVVIAFAWINLTIFDAFATGETLTVALDRAPARDLSLSVAWSVYALVLLGFGVARRSKTLRWASLLMIFATIAKVFLYDLGELEDLYRVASLVGLAFSLLAVSMLYQRFVFGASSRTAIHPSTDAPSTDA